MFKNISPLFPYLRRYRKGLAVGGLCVLLTNGIWVFFPQVLRRAMDDLLSGVTREKLIFYPLLILAVAGSKGLFQYLTRQILIGISRDIEFDLRNDLFRHLETLSLDFYQRTRTGDIMARSTNDLNAVRMLLGPVIMYSANTIVYSTAALAFMVVLSPRLTLYTFLFLPAASIIIQRFGKRIHDRFEKIQEMFSEISSRVQENLAGVRFIRAYAQEEYEKRRFAASNEEYIDRSIKLVRLMAMLFPSLVLVLGLAYVLAVWVGAHEVQAHHLTVGQYVAFLLYLTYLTFPIIAFGWVTNNYQRGTASLGRIHQLLTEKPTIDDSRVAPDLAGKPLSLRGEIEFRGLDFRYLGRSGEESGLVLHGIRLRVPAGSSLAIVGPTGSGKTTLVNLIPRILEAPEDTLFIDGRPINDYPLAELRRNIGFVPQETFLFSDTIRANIAFGSEDAPEEAIRRAAAGASIATDIEGFSEQYKTMVGERGITLSGGQKQRTAIARALVRDPRILILDDALSSVDTYTEEKILDHLREVMRGRTTILISHRVSTVRNADRIAVLHGGAIVEFGTHDELVARSGYYTDLYNKQLLEEELAQV